MPTRVQEAPVAVVVRTKTSMRIAAAARSRVSGNAAKARTRAFGLSSVITSTWRRPAAGVPAAVPPFRSCQARNAR
ncbi:MAG: hypothetical protein C3F17_17045 [Bradyrhizobiaceae bacterium]|nr:MAG: hypothetical protein C3F17_17045 [Bradyrhizobiaceae bacterium]